MIDNRNSLWRWVYDPLSNWKQQSAWQARNHEGKDVPMEQLLDASPNPAMVVDEDGTVATVNKVFRIQFGYQEEPTRAMRLDRILPGLRPSILRADVDRFRSKPGFHREAKLLTKFGESRWVTIRSVMPMNERQESKMVLHFVDVTDLRKQLRQLGNEYSRLKGILDTASDGMLVLDAHGRIIKHNRTAQILFKTAENRLLGVNITHILEPGIRPAESMHWLGDGHPVRLIAKDGGGSTFPVYVVRRTLGGGNDPFHILHIRRTVERVDSKTDVLDVEDSVRSEIGQDLHDTLGGMLSGIEMIGTTLHKRLISNDEQISREFGELLSLIREADQYAHLIAHGLIRSYVQELGFHEAMKRHCDRVSRLFRIRCEYVTPASNGRSTPGIRETMAGAGSHHPFTDGADLETPLSTEEKKKAHHLYSISQEAIHNAIRHGGATYVRVMLSRIGSQNVLVVEDNGRGFSKKPTPQKERSSNGMGMTIMRLRASQLGGMLDVNRTARETTVLECRFPAKRSKAPQPPTFVNAAI